MKYPNYVMYTKKTKKERSQLWFHYCIVHQIPFITIETRTQLADVKFDSATYTSTSSGLASIDETLRNHEDATTHRVNQLFEKYKNEKSAIAKTNWGTVDIRNIEIEHAKSMADDLYAYFEQLVS